jgi:hypothetical protein
MKDRLQSVPPTGMQIRVNLTHTDAGVLFDAFDMIAAPTRWSVLHNNYADACDHAESLGLGHHRMRDYHLGPAHPCFSYDTVVLQPKETFRGFFHTHIGACQ